MKALDDLKFERHGTQYTIELNQESGYFLFCIYHEAFDFAIWVSESLFRKPLFMFGGKEDWVVPADWELDGDNIRFKTFSWPDKFGEDFIYSLSRAYELIDYFHANPQALVERAKQSIDSRGGW